MQFRSFGPLELGIIAFIILMIFGAGKLPEVGSALGKGIWKFRRGIAREDGGDDPRNSARPGNVIQEASIEERVETKRG